MYHAKVLLFKAGIHNVPLESSTIFNMLNKNIDMGNIGASTLRYNSDDTDKAHIKTEYTKLYNMKKTRSMTTLHIILIRKVILL